MPGWAGVHFSLQGTKILVSPDPVFHLVKPFTIAMSCTTPYDGTMKLKRAGKKRYAFDRRRLAWVLTGLLVLQACGLQRKAGAGGSKDAGSVKIMTYNIRHGAAIHQPSDAVDLKAVAAVINACAPDLVALQEVDS